MLQSPRTKKVAVVRDPDMTSVLSPPTSYNVYPFQGLQSPPKAPRTDSKTPPKRLKQLDKPALSAVHSWLPLTRPYSPLGAVSPTAVVHHLSEEQYPHVKQHDLAQIEDWLVGFEQEARSFTSYFLFCELKFQQSAVLATGRDVPNRLRTAVAFYCLQQASSIFGRYQSVLDTICLNLGSAIYTSFGTLRRGRHLTALECYHAGVTYFDQVQSLQQENAQLQSRKSSLDELLVRLEQRVQQLEAENAAFKSNPGHSTVPASNTVSAFTKLALSNEFNPAANMEQREKMGYILKTFKALDANERLQVLLSQMDMIGANADMLLTMIHALPPRERNTLLDRLVQDKVQTMQSTWAAEAAVRGVQQQNEDANQYKHRLIKYQGLIQDVLAGIHVSALDIPPQDKGTIEALASLVEALAQEKDKVKRYEARVFGMTAIHAKNKADVEGSWMHKCHELQAKYDAAEAERVQLVQQLDAVHERIEAERVERAARPTDTNDKQTQVRPDELQKSMMHNADNNERKLTQLGFNGSKGHKSFTGLYMMIQEANYSVASVKRILAKKRPLSMLELHQVISGFYQTKMSQDIADDNMHRHREGLAQMLLDSYTVYYGLRELAMGQLITLDSAIRKHAGKSARIRLFGLLVGSLEPGSYASSAPAIDFLLFVVGVLFNVGNYRMHEERAQANAKQLKAWFGDGISGSQNCTMIPLDKLIQTVQTVFAHSHVTIAFMQDLCQTQNENGDVDLDVALEKIMYYWLKLYAEQIVTMHNVFELGDKDTNGVLDFSEFSAVVHHLDPDMTRRDCLELYNHVAGSDNVIDKEEFVMGMILHQRDIGLKSYFAADHAVIASSSGAPATPTTAAVMCTSATPTISKRLNTRTTGEAQPQIPFNPVRQLTMLVSKFKDGTRTFTDAPGANAEPNVNWDDGIDAVVDQFLSHKHLSNEQLTG
ncbi:hypothetical protein H310_12323 [Aphanomyces invadans]|uniref:EF-hand domain-containing protein n=1 Tax=Aphanomyces invadans TaxID=157072 RepID=A0A024TK78_9STRA|nr:hypothetical protein H310_12323 [Aphanomyces invadans]ETV93757.1 hypothetical protein H310_12323 [Aphanomyces invadans]|eukprot:XP_008877566.1 hypothetical protein H310_12323 [Aphanomyces invadans]